MINQIMSTKAFSIKSQNESTFKDGISEYHTVDEDDSCLVNDIATDNNHRVDLSEAEVTNQGSSKLETYVSKTGSDSEIITFKAQVQNIFDSFNQNMEEFESFKYKFYQTVEKYKRDSITQVESIVDQLLDNNSSNSKYDFKIENAPIDEGSQLKKIETTFYSFNNNNFHDSTPDEVSFNSKRGSEKTFNTFILSDDQILETELNSRDLMSENNIREKIVGRTPASVQDIKTLPEKIIEPVDYEQEEEIDTTEDKYIPIKSTRAKEDLKKKQEEKDYNKDEDTFFIFKICSYICKKIRRNPIA